MTEENSDSKISVSYKILCEQDDWKVFYIVPDIDPLPFTLCSQKHGQDSLGGIQVLRDKPREDLIMQHLNNLKKKNS